MAKTNRVKFNLSAVVSRSEPLILSRYFSSGTSVWVLLILIYLFPDNPQVYQRRESRLLAKYELIQSQLFFKVYLYFQVHLCGRKSFFYRRLT